MKNSERFGTEELARIEGDMLEAREKSANLEYTIFMRIREEVGKYIQRLQQLAQAIATVDVLQSLASVAESQQLNRPLFHEERRIEIDKGRHPVVEKVMGAQSYIPNSIFLWMKNGYSADYGAKYEREVYLYAPIGDYCDSCPNWFLCSSKGPSCQSFDAIYTRIGAADDLVSGQSTFMVEMMEANHAIRKATPPVL